MMQAFASRHEANTGLHMTAACRQFEFQKEKKTTYWIERGRASYSSADIIFSPERLKVAGPWSLLRRRLLDILENRPDPGAAGVVLCRVLLLRLKGVGKQSGRRVACE